ncbi:MAG TPA: histidinol dehydrogenase, partial [Myxococcales bacterium]|nr:histidinol dehydrogenase [Myxococcales bacterium]
MIRILDLADAKGRAQAYALRPSAGPPPDVAAIVSRIVADVRSRGDAALRELTHRFDGPDLAEPFLSATEWTELESRCELDVRSALEKAAERVRAFHSPQLPQSYEQRLPDGGMLKSLAIPLARVACYVPGGRAAYPSTVIMTAAVARLAGVPDVIVATPPRRDGTVPPAVAAA